MVYILALGWECISVISGMYGRHICFTGMWGTCQYYVGYAPVPHLVCSAHMWGIYLYHVRHVPVLCGVCVGIMLGMCLCSMGVYTL